MNSLLIEENFAKIDDEDMAAIIATLDEAGFKAEPTPQRFLGKEAGWVLVLHMAGDAAFTATVEIALKAGYKRIRSKFKTKDKTPPKRVVLYARDGETILLSVGHPDDDE